jgi:hypothetical protein
VSDRETGGRMKEPRNWTEEEDLLELINTQTQESITLDYKDSAALQKTQSRKTEISKDVSAFANSAGGTIVYGISEDPNDRHFPGSIDSGCDPSDITMEWLEQVINSNIQRRIDGLKINQVHLRKTHPGRVAYVVYIPQSNRAPHQAADKRFYKRYNFESVPMEEYEVRDVALRRVGPDLTVKVKMKRPSPREEIGHFTLTPAIINNGASVAKFVTCMFLIISGEYIVVGSSDWSIREGKRSGQWQTGFNAIIYPDAPTDTGDIEFAYKEEGEHKESILVESGNMPISLVFKLYAEDMSAREMKFNLQLIIEDKVVKQILIVS